MGKILFFLALLGLIFFYYSRPVAIEPPEPVKQEEKKEEPKKKVVPKKVVEPKKEPEQIIEVNENPIEKPLPKLSNIVTALPQHPYADPDKYPLHYAICKNDLDQVKKVLKKESLINELGEVVMGVKECYCPEDNYKICECNSTLIMPPLNLAILQRNEEMAKYLLRRKANPLTKDALGRNALDIAQQQNMANMQDYLAKYIK